MALQPIGQVASQFGISTRTLRYYEQIGLIKPIKTQGLTRIYDDHTVLRLKQIIVLRKLRIPLRQISEILDSGNAAVAIEVFQQSLNEIEDEINALSVIKTVIHSFTERLNLEQLGLPLLDDESLLDIVDSLTISKIHLKEERVTVSELSKSNEALDKFKERLVRVMFMPPATVAHIHCPYDDYNPDDPWRAYTESKDIIDQFIKEVDLPKIKPDFRYFGYGHPDYGIMVTIPEDVIVSAPLDKRVYPGGLFAVYTNGPENHDDWNILHAWLHNNDAYEYDARGKGLEEYFNPRNMHGLKNDNTEYYDFYLPIKEK